MRGDGQGWSVANLSPLHPFTPSPPRGAMAEAVEGDGEDDDPAGDDFLDPVGEIELRASIADGGHDHRAYQAAEDRALTAGEARAADDDRGDGGELVSDRRGGVADGEVG